MDDTPHSGPDPESEQPERDITAGKRLVRQDGASVSLGDRLMAKFYRLFWTTRLHGLRLKGRHPLKLTGVPDDPVSGDADLGDAMARGLFVHHGEAVEVNGPSITTMTASAAFTDWFHGFSWLRDLDELDRMAALPVAEGMVKGWLDAHGDTVSDPAWRPDVAARRIMHWAAHAPLILASTDLIYRSAVLNHFARAGRHLDQTADRMPHGIQRIISWCGVIAMGILIAGNEPRRLFGEAGLAKALAGGLTDDGGTLCRSPDAQCDLIDALVMLRSVYGLRKLPMPEPLHDALTRSASALAGLMLGDGALSSWQGSVPAARVAAILDAVGPSVRPLRHARGWGYQRVSSGGTVLIFDTAPPPLGHVSANGCASTLAIELSDGAQRIIVNCGGARAGGLAGMTDLSEGLRTTAAHSTLTLSDSNSTALHKGGAIGKGVTETTLDRQDLEAGSKLDASHDGYLRRFGYVHQRSVTLSSDGAELKGEDTLLPGGKKRKGETGFAVRFHLAPGIEASPTADGLGALLRLPGGGMWQFRGRGGALGIEDSLWIGPDGLMQGSTQLVMAGQAEPGGATIGWIFKRAS